MISVAEARAIILANAQPMPIEQIELAHALGRTLRAPLAAERAQPPFAASAMDGFAVRSADTPGTLHLIGEAGAGRALGKPLRPGECARIFTGAPMPAGADAVVIQEEARRDGDKVQVPPLEPGKHVRRAGADFSEGAELLPSGQVLHAGAITLAAAAGRALLPVSVKPRVAVLSGGDEIVPPGADPGPHQIFDSVSYGVSALCQAWGAAPLRTAPLCDDRVAIAKSVAASLRDSDLLVLIGGASVGDHDHARPALTALGAELLFAKVALRPGKPTWFARCAGKLVLGLPGNPASALVCARLFLLPLLKRLLGADAAPASEPRKARLRGMLKPNGDRETYLRALTATDERGQLQVESFANQDSSSVSIFASSNALLVRAPHAPAAHDGEFVDILDL